MPTTYKPLGQVLPTDTGNNEMYQVPAATSTVVSTISIANTTAVAATARIFVKKTAFDLTQSVTSSFGGTALGAVAYGNGVYVAGGNTTGTSYIVSGTDGSTWTSRTIAGLTGNVTTVSWGNGLFVAGATAGTLSTSTDGTTWTSRTSNAGSNALLASVYGTTLLGANLYVAAGAAGALTTSPDGTTWTSRTSGFSTTQINALGYGAGLFIAGGASGTMTTSLDGTTWTARTSGFSTNAINGIAYGNGTFVAVGAAGTITRSPDGITWTASTSGTASAINAVIWTGSQFVAITATTVVLTSPDGITWTSRTSISANGIAYGNARYVMANGSSVASLFGSIPTKSIAVMYDTSMAANSTTAMTLGITLAAGDALVVQSGTASALSFAAFGSEIS